MPVSALTYVYLILFIASLLCALLAALKHDETLLETFSITTPLFFIGFACERFAIQSV